MQRLLPIVALIAVLASTAAVAAVQGLMSNRWQPAVDLDAVRQRISSVPAAFGDWETRDEQKLTKRTEDMLQVWGYVNRTYVNRKTADIVQVALLAGPSGPIAAHTPEVCYPALALDIAEASQRARAREAEVPNEDFQKVMFRSRGLDATYLRVWYAWNGGKNWTVPTYPRWYFSSAPVLYKLQIASVIPTETSADSDDACAAFLRDFLPVLDQQVFQRKSRG